MYGRQSKRQVDLIRIYPRRSMWSVSRRHCPGNICAYFLKFEMNVKEYTIHATKKLHQWKSLVPASFNKSTRSSDPSRNQDERNFRAPGDDEPRYLTIPWCDGSDRRK
jgi:hypothetical protein